VAAFEGMNASVEPVETVLHGPVQDQAALYGLLDRIQALGLELVEVRRLPDPPAEPEITAEGEVGSPVALDPGEASVQP
jgi:hypothetical protein